MYFNNDSAWRQTGLSSRTLSQIILLLLTTLTGCESSSAGWLPDCLFSGEEEMREELDTEKKRQRAASLFSWKVFLCERVHLYMQHCFLPLCKHTHQCISTANVYLVCSSYAIAPRCPQRFKTSTWALSKSTLLWPQWLILTQAAAGGNQYSALSAQNIMEACLSSYMSVWMIGRPAAHLDACLCAYVAVLMAR